MSISARVTNNVNHVKAKVQPNDTLLVTNYMINAQTLRIGDLFNVDTASAVDGSMLIYNANTTVWEATVQLDRKTQIISGGNY